MYELIAQHVESVEQDAQQLCSFLAFNRILRGLLGVLKTQLPVVILGIAIVKFPERAEDVLVVQQLGHQRVGPGLELGDGLLVAGKVKTRGATTTVQLVPAAAAPPDEPPLEWPRFQGLRVGPKAMGSVVGK